MDMPANRFDAYFNKTRKDCNDLIEFHAMATVSDDLLLHAAGMKWKDN